MAESIVISGAVEGPVDEAVLRRLVRDSGAVPGTFYGKKGKDRLVQQVSAYNHAARLSPWIVLMDLDRDADCAAGLRNRLLPNEPVPNLCLRIAVRTVEAWLLADRERFSDFFAVAASKVPPSPEFLPDPKRTIIELARSSRRKEIRSDMIPRPESGRPVGPAYTSRMIEYIESAKGWRPAVAAEAADSLRRCLKCIQRLIRQS
ncbi:MAG: hypothetical protein ABUT39_25495 [Acidobacteriota bacterium]